MIRAGSAIVGSRHGSEGRPVPARSTGWTVDFEGNIHGASNMKTFEDRLQSAAGRQSVSYPTGARLVADEDEVIEIGIARHSDLLRGWFVESLSEPARLAKWLGTEPLPRIGGSIELWGRAVGHFILSSQGRLGSLTVHSADSASLRDSIYKLMLQVEPDLKPPFRN